jgi:hypothetical protein
MVQVIRLGFPKDIHQTNKVRFFADIQTTAGLQFHMDITCRREENGQKVGCQYLQKGRTDFFGDR